MGRPKGEKNRKYSYEFNLKVMNEYFVNHLGWIFSDNLAHRGKLYELTLFLDVYNDSIITWDISSKHGDVKPYFNCRDSLPKLIKKEELSEPIYFHTDQGTVYSSISFNQALLISNIIRSMSRVGTPTDNPIIKSINGWIKAQIKYDYRINDYDDIRKFIKQYVHYYNHERPMYKLNYKSPAEYKLLQGYKLSF